MKIRLTNNQHRRSAAGAILIGVLLTAGAGCTSLSPQSSGRDDVLFSRTAKAPYNDVYRLAVQSAQKAFPAGIIQSGVGVIMIRNYSVFTGDMDVAVEINEMPDDSVRLRISADRFDASTHRFSENQRKALEALLREFDRAYAEWKQLRNERRAF